MGAPDSWITYGPCATTNSVSETRVFVSQRTSSVQTGEYTDLFILWSTVLRSPRWRVEHQIPLPRGPPAEVFSSTSTETPTGYTVGDFTIFCPFPSSHPSPSKSTRNFRYLLLFLVCPLLYLSITLLACIQIMYGCSHSLCFGDVICNVMVKCYISSEF